MIKLLILFFFCFSTFAAKDADDFRIWRDLGEFNQTNQSGIEKSLTFDLTRDQKSPNEDEFYINNLLAQKVQGHPYELTQFWFNSILNESLCPNEEIALNIDYIRYLYRLVTMSYSFESLKRAKKISDELGLKSPNCEISFKQVFGDCSPKSEEMRKFHQRVFGKFNSDGDPYKTDRKTKKDIEEWWNEFKRSNLTIDPMISRIKDNCDQHGLNCKTLKESELSQEISFICNEDKTVILNACNEVDDLMGVSYSDRMGEIIKGSNAFNLINKNGYGEDCLRRFTRISKYKEIKYPHLAKLIPLMHATLIKENARYKEGELFMPGALKEFDMKGLSDFLVALKPSKPKVVAQFKKVPVKVEAPKPEPVPVKVETAPVVVVKVEEPVSAPPPPPKISEFERALLQLKKFNAESAQVNMETFREDFLFSQEEFQALEIPLKKFQTRKALQDMKQFDQLGTSAAPIGLMFLKFLMDSENHQGLYNIQSVIGAKFFVNNDFEGKTEPVYVELKNDASTGFKWAIIILKKK